MKMWETFGDMALHAIACRVLALRDLWFPALSPF